MADAKEHKNIQVALAAAQSEMGRAAKDTNNPHFKSKYADLASVMDACMGPLSKHGISVVQPTFDEGDQIYVKTILSHGASETHLECRVPLMLAKRDMQGYGSAVTYARRYGLMGMAGIAADDDDGNAAAASGPAPQRQEQRGPTPEQLAKHEKAVDDLVFRIEMAETSAELGDIWREANERAREVVAEKRCIAAKDKRKSEIAARASTQ
jgi:hypothetical protein